MGTGAGCVCAYFMCFPMKLGDSPVAGSGPDKEAVLKYRVWFQNRVRKRTGMLFRNSSGMGRDLAAVLQLENLTGAASGRRLGLLTPARPVAASFQQLHTRLDRVGLSSNSVKQRRGRGLFGPCVSRAFFPFLPADCFEVLSVCGWWKGLCMCGNN